MMAVKIAILNQKGGVGKSTTCFNVAGVLAKNHGSKVLCIDCDASGNLSNALLSEQQSGFDKENSLSLADLITSDINVSDVIIKACIKSRENATPKYMGISVLPCNKKITGMRIDNVYVLKNKLEPVENEYDYMIFDLPPSLTENTIAVLATVNYVLVPLSVDMDSVEGYSELIDTLNTIRSEGINENIHMLGTFITNFDSTAAFDKFILETFKDSFRDIFFDIPIFKSTDVKQSRYFLRPLVWYKRTAKATKAYEKLTEQVLNKIKYIASNNM